MTRGTDDGMAPAREQEREREGPGAFSLWFGALGAPAAWFAHLNIVYVLVPVLCREGIVIPSLLVSLVFAGVAAGAGVTAWRNWSGLTEQEQGRLIDDMEGSRTGFMLYGGMLASGLFLLAIIMATLPVFFVDPCSQQGRI